jgi:hypothetical protein
LVAARVVEPAEITGTFYIAVWQEAALCGRKPLELLVFVHIPVLQECCEHGLRHFEVILGVGGGKQVISQSKLLKKLKKAVMITLVDSFRS